MKEVTDILLSNRPNFRLLCSHTYELNSGVDRELHEETDWTGGWIGSDRDFLGSSAYDCENRYYLEHQRMNEVLWRTANFTEFEEVCQTFSCRYNQSIKPLLFSFGVF